jgi:alpha-tubulin suppressor-like RCC1 family protein
MSYLLWKHYWDDDVDKFRRLLAPAGYSAQAASRSPNVGSGGSSAFATSPRGVVRSRKGPNAVPGGGSNRHGSAALGKVEVNSRDHAGLTLLLRAASSTSENAVAFVQALLDHPATDLYAQDPESGWNALHRALYTGNIAIARLLLEKERQNLSGLTIGASAAKIGLLIKTKDHEGNSPFDVYNSTIGIRDLRTENIEQRRDDDSETEDLAHSSGDFSGASDLQSLFLGNELFTFGSNKNLTLGLGDEDDRHFPERVSLKRPDHLLQRFFAEYQEAPGTTAPSSSLDMDKIPAAILARPLLVQDAVLSKLHSAILTTDPVSNLYVCGVGRGGRLGLGDENTRFTFCPVQGGLADKKVAHVALGQNHSMAVADNGELWTWGSNEHSQLGYALPTPASADETPCSTTPRQVFGTLKKEIMSGVAASAIHSVAFTGSSLYCWGKNVGQLALMDADSRSLEIQTVPRRVAASLFSSPIVMVSAIDKATTCLLANHTVCVFTGYGYNIVKFPFGETIGNAGLGSICMSSRYEPGRTEIHAIASGGDTIAATTGRGDLFTMTLNRVDANSTAQSSTTNPSKIKGAVTQPQCIWTARKDGVRSFGVSEHGSVIISTHSGAVWTRVKRSKAKDAFTDGPVEMRRKDYKFQRIPNITNVVTVRSSAFGAFCAIRRDSDVMRQQINIGQPTLLEDISSLCCLRDFEASEPEKGDYDILKISRPELVKARIGSIAYEILQSPDLEADLQRLLTSLSYQEGAFDVLLCSSTLPGLAVPIHAWILGARSVVFRRTLRQFRQKGELEEDSIVQIAERGGKLLVTFAGLDLLSVLNLVLYCYCDRIIPAWEFGRQAPALAYRYRQVRSELMRISTQLKMADLEAAVRMQTLPRSSIANDFRTAIRERTYFDDGDAVVQLEGAEIPVHTALIRQRCPWFEGLFHGRSGGMWLAQRRQDEGEGERVQVDLQDVDPRTFRFILEYIYGDVGPEMFDKVVLPDFDDFIDLVMDVLHVADELLLDRLSQICQQVLGRYVNTRSIAPMLNAVSPYAITEFKDAGLEYVCLQMENMLENHLLDDLEDDLMTDLDAVVRENQTARYPFVRSGRSELLLHEKYPDLAADIDEERQRRVKEMAYKSRHRDDERKLSSSLKGRAGSLDETLAMTRTPDRRRRGSRASRNEPFSPDLRPKDSRVDLMFEMDEGEESSVLSSPLATPSKNAKSDAAMESIQLDDAARAQTGSMGPDVAAAAGSAVASPPSIRYPQTPSTPPRTSPDLPSPGSSSAMSPWARAPALPTTKLDLRQIMSESSVPSSALAAGLAAQRSKDAASRLTNTKVSQKERKRQQQEQAHASQTEESKPEAQAAWQQVPAASRPAPWQRTPSAPKTSLKDVMSASASKPSAPLPNKPLVAAEALAKSIPRRTASPDTRFSGQARTASYSGGPGRPSPRMNTSDEKSRPLVPHSKTYMPTRSQAESTLGLSLDDIILREQRERDSVKEAMAKRSLQEIQQEQEFQEWWDQESRRTQEEESRRAARESGRGKETKEGRGKPKARGGRGNAGRARGSESGGPRRAGAVGGEAKAAATPGNEGKGKGRG